MKKHYTDKVKKDLSSIIEGESFFDDYHRILYSTAACIFQIVPLGVVFPANEEDLRKLILYARENEIPMTARGAGSGVAGQTVSSGLIVDFSKYMNKIVEIDPGGNLVRVQPGLVYDHLNLKLKDYGKFFPPDPSSGPFCTIGGMIGNNAGGSHSVLYGSMKENIRSIRGWTSDGHLLETRPVTIDSSNMAQTKDSILYDYSRKLAHFLEGKEDLLRRWKPQVNRNSSGYNIFDSCRWNALQDRVIDLTQLIVGSEGTLCIVTEAVLKIRDRPTTRGTAISLFDRLEKAGEAVMDILSFSPSCLEIMDHTLVTLTRDEVAEMREALPEECQAILIFEIDGEEPEEVDTRLEQIRSCLLKKKLAFKCQKALTPSEQEKIWNIRKSASPILSSKEGKKRNTRFVEDASILPERLPEFIQGMKKILSKHGLPTVIFGHAGDSNIHVNPILSQMDPVDLDKMEMIADEVADLVFSLKGSLTGEHGDGRLRSRYLPKMFGPLYTIFEEVKDLFDPTHLLNPGIKVGVMDKSLTHHLRYGRTYRRRATGTILDEESWQIEVEKCHGCGTCRQYCPVFQVVGDEKATARGKANLLRSALSRRLDINSFFDSRFKEMMDLCFNCGLCHAACPTKIKIPELSRIAKDIYCERRGLDKTTLLLDRSLVLSRWLTALAPLSNALLKSKLMRKVGEFLTGISSTLSFEGLSRSVLEKNGGESPQLMGKKKAAYFYGCYASFHDPEGEGMDTIEVLRKNGFGVVLPPQACCGIASLSNGDTRSVMADASFNVEILSSFIEQGFVVIYSAPSCGMALVREYPELLKTDQSRMVAENSFEIHEFLRKLKVRGELNEDFGMVKERIVYHNPCHLKARDMGQEIGELLKMIPELELVEIEDACCGMAGTFGMKSRNRDLSLDIGRPLFERIRKTEVPMVATGCGTCHIQIENATGKKVVHPISLLARSYRAFSTSSE